MKNIKGNILVFGIMPVLMFSIMVYSSYAKSSSRTKRVKEYDDISHLNERQRWDEINRMLKRDKFKQNACVILKELYRSNSKYDPNKIAVFPFKDSVVVYYKNTLLARLKIPPSQRSRLKKSPK